MNRTRDLRSASRLLWVLCLFGCSVPQAARITYIDATDGESGNTRLANGEVFIAQGSPLIGDDNLWSKRPEGNDGSVFTTNDGRPSGPEDGPGLVTTISGLRPAQPYQVYAYFWTDQYDWRLKASLTEFEPPGDDPSVSFGKIGSPSVNPASIAREADFAIPIMLTESNRQLLQADLGEINADSTGKIRVWIDDQAAGRSSNRTWYDGVGVRPATTAPPAMPRRPVLIVVAVVAVAAAVLYVFLSLIQNRRRPSGRP